MPWVTCQAFDILPGPIEGRGFPRPGLRRFTFLVLHRVRSGVPYRVQGRVMRPVRRSLKNHRTAQAHPIPDIHRGIGISMCLSATAVAAVDVFVSGVDLPTAVAGFRGVLQGPSRPQHRPTASVLGLMV